MASGREHMDLRFSVKEQMDNILNLLKGKHVTTVLVGEVGMGKSWVARAVSDRAIKERVFSRVIWLSLNRTYDEKSLYEKIARQLSILPIVEECEENQKKEDDNVEDLKRKIAEELAPKLSLALGDEGRKTTEQENIIAGEPTPKLLLVLDDEGRKTTEEQIMIEFGLEDFLKPKEPFKVLITRRNKYTGSSVVDDRKEVRFGPLPDDDLHNLLMKSLDKEIRNCGVLSPELKSTIVERSMGVPTAVVVIAKAINAINRSAPRTTSALEQAFKEVDSIAVLDSPKAINHVTRTTSEITLDFKKVDSVAVLDSPNAINHVTRTTSEITQDSKEEVHSMAVTDSPKASTSKGETCSEINAVSEPVLENNNPLLRFGYKTLTTCDKMVCCFCHSLDFFRECGSVHFAELITHWILEGFFGPLNNVEQAYQDGHSVLMKLIDRNLLRIQEDNVVIPEEAMIGLNDLRHYIFSRPTSLRLASVLGSKIENELGRITLIDGMIKTLYTNKETISVMLIGGTRLCEEVPEKFFGRMPDLEVLGLFEPILRTLKSLSKLKKLRVLVIRECDLLDNIDDIKDLQELTAIEISGASSLEKISDELFRKMPQLQSLNLSKLPVDCLPSTISNLTELRWLILQDLPNLKELPQVQFLTKLEVFDVCGAGSLENTKGKNKNKNFSTLVKLQKLDLSHSQIARLPIFTSIRKCEDSHSLTQLILKDCKSLARLTLLKPLAGLQLLDLSGASKLSDILDECFEDKKKLRILDLSGTSISNVPSNIKLLVGLTHLRVRGCPLLMSLPDLETLVLLKELDVSGCSLLKSLPDLETVVLLKKLYVLGCPLLKSLPNLETLVLLEELDVSGCVELTELKGSFEGLSCLWKLDLSHTKIKNLHSFPKPCGLTHVFLKGCSFLENLPTMNELGSLQELDLSGCQSLTPCPQLDASQNLQRLDLSGCSAFEAINVSFDRMPYLQKLNLSDTKIKRIPSLKNSSELCHLVLKNCTNLENLSFLQESLPELVELDLCGLKCLADIGRQFGENMPKLNILDLSGVAFEEFSCCVNLTNLSQLSIRVNFEPPVQSDSSIDQISNLDDIYLNALRLLKNLEILKLSGIATIDFLYQVLRLPHLKHCIILGDLNIIQKVDKKTIEGSNVNLSWEECGLSLVNNKIMATVTDTKVFERNSGLWDKLKDFYICVNLSQESGKEESRVYNDMYFRMRNFPSSQQPNGYLEIHGSDAAGCFPDCVKQGLTVAEYVCFVDNMSASCSSILHACNMKQVKGCWLVKCPNMENVYDHKDGDVALENLKMLWVSNLPYLRSLCCDDSTSDVFKNLKELYLDCCPMLKSVFTASTLPSSLEILHIKFCDELETVCSEECELPNLEELFLFDLPKLKNVRANMRKLNTDRCIIKKCPEMRHTNTSLKADCEITRPQK